MARYVIGISGASGIVLALRAITTLAEQGHQIHLVISSHAAYAAGLEMGKEFGSSQKFYDQLPVSVQEKTILHSIHDVGASIASGSFQTDGMLLIPCSMATVAAIAYGFADNCLRRAADVTIKEKRRLVIVPRESPLSDIHLENLLRLSRFGATIVPPVPAWYNGPQTLADIENFIVGKALDALGVMHQLYPRWKSDQGTGGC